MLVDVGLRMLHRNRPLLVPPIGLAHHATVHHAEPVMPPQIDIDSQPVTIVANLFWIQHQYAVRTSASDVPLQSNLGDGLFITIRSEERRVGKTCRSRWS